MTMTMTIVVVLGKKKHCAADRPANLGNVHAVLNCTLLCVCYVLCYVLCVTCYVLRVTCYVLRVMWQSVVLIQQATKVDRMCLNFFLDMSN